jgi:alpha-D-ribose 1-methylphosphonate 5-triphosphate synthase subunit PhnI
MNEDFERIDWIETVASEVEVSIQATEDGFRIKVGRIELEAVGSLRQAFDDAMRRTA